MSFLTNGLPQIATFTGLEAVNGDTNAAAGGIPQSVSIPLSPGVYEALQATLQEGESWDDGVARLLDTLALAGMAGADAAEAPGPVTPEAAVERVDRLLTRQEEVLRRPKVREGLRRIKRALVAWEEL